MSYNESFAAPEPERREIDAGSGNLVLEFGTPWCGHCRAAQPLIREILEHADTDHIRVEDGRGRRLGRSFRIKLWPTLIFLRDGEEMARVVRPTDTAVIREALARLEGND
ncbi:Thioredoxin domain protein [Alloalcanivorax dieselolei B5]|uniref:Thioredoxin domain protein n=1 Tax=Alcanivorax dieselolei (strain DSM 16502 / CGMCC 1.3690 / MCCC 1A00001 / B-5) TaxID=930169 RepID=K0CDI8_ALCDB|nr:thioredoxin family protein [Alloalcanivorax dieselolei]AFT69636.1 Thioredoxin domain protein [Alloalcanivorax dieselolei B5]GGK03526.1 thiol reductase thioredoxin [Alloalcanivorax dieselolei]